MGQNVTIDHPRIMTMKLMREINLTDDIESKFKSEPGAAKIKVNAE